MRERFYDSVNDPSQTSQDQPPEASSSEKYKPFVSPPLLYEQDTPAADPPRRLFWQIPHEVATDPQLSPAAKLAYGGIRFIFSGRHSGIVTLRKLCLILGKCERSVKGYTRQLRRAGHIAVEPRPGDESRYTLLRERVAAFSSPPTGARNYLGSGKELPGVRQDLAPPILTEQFTEQFADGAAAAAASSTEGNCPPPAAAAGTSLPRSPEGPDPPPPPGASAPFAPGTYLAVEQKILDQYPRADLERIGEIIGRAVSIAPGIPEAHLLYALDQARDPAQRGASLYLETLPSVLAGWKQRGTLGKCPQCGVILGHGYGVVDQSGSLVKCPTCHRREQETISEVKDETKE